MSKIKIKYSNQKIADILLKIGCVNINFKKKKYELIIDLQKVVIRSIKLKQIHHDKYFSATANFLFSDFKNEKKDSISFE